MRMTKIYITICNKQKVKYRRSAKKQSGGIKKKKVKYRSIIQDVVMWKTYHGIM